MKVVARKPAVAVAALRIMAAPGVSRVAARMPILSGTAGFATEGDWARLLPGIPHAAAAAPPTISPPAR